MSKSIGPKIRARLIKDIIDAKQDVVTLSRSYGLKPDDLAAWVAEPVNARCLQGLCKISDLQTQLVVSRYRLLAASHLISVALKDKGGEQSRRACVDLLRVDLKRAEARDDDDDGDDGDTWPTRQGFYDAADEAAEPAVEDGRDSGGADVGNPGGGGGER